MRILRGVAALAVAAAVAGCTGTTAGSGTVAADVPAGSGTATASGSAGPTRLPLPPTTSAAPTRAPATPTATPVPSGEREVAFGIVRITLPQTWNATIDGGTLLCLTASGDDGCTLVVVDIGRIRAAGGSVSTPDPAGEFGWWYGSDVPNCDPSGDRYVPVTKSTRVEGPTTRPLGTKTAAYASWLVSCQGGDLDFDPRLWWLPTSRVAFVERSSVAGAGEAVDALLRGVRFTA